MGRKKTPPPKQTLHIGDRVEIVESHNYGGLTGIIESVRLQGRGGSDQFWVYQVVTHQKFINKDYTKTRYSIRAYKESLIVLKRKDSPLKQS